MRNYTYNILTAIMFMAGVVSVNAQTLDEPTVENVSEQDYVVVKHNNSYHVVQGTQVTVTLNATIPASTDSKRYEQSVTYRKGSTDLAGNVDTFTPINGTVSYTAVFHYKNYQNGVTDNVIHDETSPAQTIAFTTYSTPQIDKVTVSPAKEYTLQNSGNVAVDVSYSPVVSGLTAKINWEVNGTAVSTQGSQHNLPTSQTGDFTVKATVTVYAPDGNTIWGGPKSDEKKIVVFEKPAVTEIVPARKYALVGDDAFNVEARVSKDARIEASVVWSGGVEGTELVGSFNPKTKTATSYTVGANVTFKDPKGNELTSDNTKSATITVYDVPTITEIVPARKYALVGDEAFNVEVKVNKHNDITTSVVWSEGVDGTALVASFNPKTKTAKTYPVSATVTFKDPDGKTLVQQASAANLSKQIVVYNRPTVNQVTPARKYALVGDAAFNVVVDVSKDNGISTVVEWTGGVTGESTALSGTFTPQTANTFTVSAKVTFNDPEGAKLTEGTKNATIVVFEKPSITEIAPARSYALVGDNAFNVEAKVNKDSRIKTSVEWLGGVTGSALVGSFNPSTAGPHTVSAKVTFLDPEDQPLTNPVTSEGKTIKVYEKPTASDIDIKFKSGGQEVSYTFVRNTVDVEVEVNVDNELTAKVASWTPSTVTKVGDLTATFVAPSSARTQAITARVTFYAPDESELITLESRKNIEIYAMTLNPNKVDTYRGDPDFTVGIVGFPSQIINGEERYEPEVTWSSNVVQKTNELVTTLKDENDIQGEQVISAKIRIKLKGTNLYLDSEPSDLEPVTVMVYTRPNVDGVNITSSQYSYVGGSCQMKATLVNKTPDNLTPKIYWYVDDVRVANVEGEDFTYTPTGEGTPNIKAEAVFYSPSVADEVWPGGKTSDSKQISVYPNPRSVVTGEVLNNKVSEPYANNPNELVGYVGQEVSFLYSISTPDNRYNWEYSWELNGTLESEESGSVTFNNLDGKLNEGENLVTVIAQPLNPDGTGEKWGEPIRYTLPNPITIYSAPDCVEKDMHKQETTDEHKYEYAFFAGVDVPFNAANLVDNIGGYPQQNGCGWESKLYVDNNTEPEPDLNFRPQEAKDYKLKLVVKNVAPTGVWFSAVEKEYTLHVYEKPEWSTNFDQTFDGNANTLHVESGDDVRIVTNLSKGDAANWTVKGSIEGEESLFQGTGNERTFTFNRTNDQTQEQSYSLGVLFNYEVPYMVAGLESYCEESVERTIVVWKEITAGVTSPTVVTEGKFILEAREGDTDAQVMSINLVGGDANKWTITPVVGENPEGTPVKNGYKYDYIINGGDLTANGTDAKTYNYSFTAEYNDGQTHKEVPYNLSVIVWPIPELAQSLALSNKSSVSYNEQSGNYTITCYEDDVLQMSVTPTGGKTGEAWKYQIGSGTKTDLPSNGKITVAGTGAKTIKFFNYLGSNEKVVKSVTAQIVRKTMPDVQPTLPTVDMTNATIWNAAQNEANRVDLYADGTQKANFQFSPKSGSEGNETGWSYNWKLNGVSRSTAGATWSYTVETSSSNPYEDKTISVDIKNSISASAGQNGENIGYEETKTYYVRAWHKAELPTGYSLEDLNNSNNNIFSTNGIREGNTLKANVDAIRFGYNPNNGANYHYEWKGQGSQVDVLGWETANIKNTDETDKRGSSKSTYGLRVYNQGPRGTKWAEKEFDDCEVSIYNRPKTPTRLVKKGNGTSGTMIIEYEDMSDTELIARGDYVINFCYTENGDQTILSKSQKTQGEVRWATGYSGAQMDNAFVYAHWLDEENGVLITSGKRTVNGNDETWDQSIYNLTSQAIDEIRAMTRAGGGDYTDIESIDPDEITEGDISVYNINGMKVGTSTEGLTPGVYVIRYRQDGVVKSKKLSVK